MDVIKDILGSKKHLVAIGAICIVALNKKLGLGLTSEEIKWISGIASALILGQGAADLGKGKVQVEHKLNNKVKEDEIRKMVRERMEKEGK